MITGQAGHLYGCWGTKRGGPNTAIGNTSTFITERDGYVQKVQEVGPIETPWLGIPCGYDRRWTDSACRGCLNSLEDH